jgi:hypothetical protein
VTSQLWRNNTILTYNAQNLTTATSTTAIVGLPAAENNIVVIIDLLLVSCMHLDHQAEFILSMRSQV